MMAFGFGKKKREQIPFPSDMPPPPSLGPPTDVVLGMRQQGFTNNQIVQALQREGYTSDQIFDAMSQADIKGGIQEIPPPPEMMATQTAEPIFAQVQYPQAQPAQMPMQESNDKEAMEELIEEIIDEKWTDFSSNINKIVEWKTKTEARMDSMEEKIEQLQKGFDELHKAILGRIGEYDKHISEIGTDIKAMEKVFQKVLPIFTQNVNELSRLVKSTKKKKS